MFVVVHELAKHLPEMTAAKDQQVVRASRRMVPTLRSAKCIRPRSAEGNPDDLHDLAAEDGIESGRKLGVPVTEAELHGSAFRLQPPGQIAGLWHHPLG